MRPTALEPPPPTPTTLIRVPICASSSIRNFKSFSSSAILVPHLLLLFPFPSCQPPAPALLDRLAENGKCKAEAEMLHHLKIKPASPNTSLGPLLWSRLDYRAPVASSRFQLPARSVPGNSKPVRLHRTFPSASRPRPSTPRLRAEIAPCPLAKSPHTRARKSPLRALPKSHSTAAAAPLSARALRARVSQSDCGQRRALSTRSRTRVSDFRHLRSSS